MKISDLVQSPAAESDAIKSAIMEQLHVALPGIVTDYDAGTQTATVQPTIRDKLDGKAIDLPLLLDVPVYMPGGSSGAIYFPVEAGDECLVVFADTCIDAWMQSGGKSTPAAIPRRHSLSDGFAFVGFRSRNNALHPPNGPRLCGDMLDMVYPVGTVYTTTGSVSPANLFGGQWSEISTGVWERVM